MKILVNGEVLEMDTQDRKLGPILAELDKRIENAGGIITGISADGHNIDADSIDGFMENLSTAYLQLEIIAENADELKKEAIKSFLTIIASSPSGGNGNSMSIENWNKSRSAYNSLFNAEETAFLDVFEEAQGPDSFERIRMLETFLEDRLEELENPLDALSRIAVFFDKIKGDISEVSVKMQTGRDEQAMKTILMVIELFNKTIRILPGYMRKSKDAENMQIQGMPVDAFYNDFNTSLRELAGAFENKDGVLIGDLAEYEILPRLEAFFDAVKKKEGGR